MGDPSFVRGFSLDIGNGNPDPVNGPISTWGDLALANGYPSLLLFFSYLEQKGFLEKKEVSIVHSYVLKIKEAIETEGIQSLSLFSGVAGVCFALKEASIEGARYQRMLTTLHTHLLNRVTSSYLEPIEQNICLNRPSSSRLYDPIQGISGIGRYALENLSDPRFFQLAESIVKTLVRISQPLFIDDRWIPGWLASPSDPTNASRRKENFKGNFNLGLAHGVTGILAFLSVASLKGIEIEGQKEAIARIGEWICEKSFVNNGMVQWPYTISWEEEVEKRTGSYTPSRDAWCYGAPGIARTLFLAGKAIDNKKLQNFSSSAFESIFSRTREEWNIPGPTLCHGVAGLLLITNEMAKEAGHEKLFTQVDSLKEMLLTYYNLAAPFGFKDIEPCRSGISTEVSKVGFLEGSVGIFLTLLSLSDTKMNWHLPLLIHE